MELNFADGFSIWTIKIEGYNIIVSVPHLGIKNLPMEKTIMRGNTSGVIKEFPELKGLPEEEIIAVGRERFKEKIKKLKTEENIVKYIITEMESQGMKYLGRQRRR